MKQSPSKGDGALNPMTNLTIAEQDDTLAYGTLKAVGLGHGLGAGSSD